MDALAGGHLLEQDGIDVEIWRYRFLSERDYVSNFEEKSKDPLEAWRVRYIVHEDTLSFN